MSEWGGDLTQEVLTDLAMPDTIQHRQAWPVRDTSVLAIMLLLTGALQVGTVSSWGNDQLSIGMAVYAFLNVTSTGLVGISAWRLHGLLRFRLTAVMNTAFLLHGALAFSVLILRLPFSRSAMLIGLLSSAICGVAVVLLRERLAGPRVGIIASAADEIQAVAVATQADVICSPTQDLRRYNVILTPMAAPLSTEWSAAVSRAMLFGAQLRHAAEYLEEARGQTSVPHFHIDHLSDRAVHYMWVKRATDLAATLFFLPVTAPVMLLTALIILVRMGRPVLFVQERVGLGGKTFRMFKFRTMAPDPSGQASATSVGDLRVTPLGRVLRRYRVDELPQFVNIARGDMSLIGPRPEQPALHKQYACDEPAFVYRTLVRPGLSGWAQIRSGYASNLAESRVKLSYDLYYVKNLSMGLDLQIAVRTVWALVTGYGAR